MVFSCEEVGLDEGFDEGVFFHSELATAANCCSSSNGKTLWCDDFRVEEYEEEVVVVDGLDISGMLLLKEFLVSCNRRTKIMKGNVSISQSLSLLSVLHWEDVEDEDEPTPCWVEEEWSLL